MPNMIMSSSFHLSPSTSISWFGCALIGLLVWLGGLEARAGSDELPNIIIIFTDDQGYADLGTSGGGRLETPNLDRMGREGTRFTDFYVAQPSCTPSRAALLTGTYPNRIGLPRVIGPAARHGLSAGEMTLPELVKQRDYATAIFGKWHLGHHPEFLPTRHGFDEFFGLPYSNDMWPLHPTHGHRYPPLPLMEGEEVVNSEVTAEDQEQFTTWFTERAVDFIERNKDEPFLLYLPHPQPHVPLFVSDKFRGKSGQGLYGDVIMEIDWSVGQILDALEKHGLDERTLVIFTSDNGPWLSYGEHGGSAYPLREGKATSWEGGMRVPCVMRWPGKIPAGQLLQVPVMTIDILPTIAGLTGADLPDHRIDGKDVWPLISGKPGADSPHEAYLHYRHDRLEAIRSGRWKLYFPHEYLTLAGKPGGTGGQPVRYEKARAGLELYDLQQDWSESNDVADQYPEVVRRLQKLAEEAREDLGDSLTDRPGANLREPGRVPRQAQ